MLAIDGDSEQAITTHITSQQCVKAADVWVEVYNDGKWMITGAIG
jgi:hypothetical protein